MTLASIGMASSSACDAKQNLYKGYRLVVTIMCQSEHVHVSQKCADFGDRSHTPSQIRSQWSPQPLLTPEKVVGSAATYLPAPWLLSWTCPALWIACHFWHWGTGGHSMAVRAWPSCCHGPSLSAVVIGAAPLVLEHTHTCVRVGSGQSCTDF